MTDVTRILNAIDKGDPHAADKLLPLVYDELRELRLSDSPRKRLGKRYRPPRWCMRRTCVWSETSPSRLEGRRHFFAAAAEAMRRILIDRARQKGGKKTRRRRRPRAHRSRSTGCLAKA